MAEIKERLALGRVEHQTSGGAASRGVARRVANQLDGTLTSAAQAGDEDEPELDYNPDPDPDEPGVLRDDDEPTGDEGDLDLPDVSELDGRGGNVSRPRPAQALPPDHMPRMVEKVIRDPRLAAKMRSRETATPTPNISKGNAWGRETAPEPVQEVKAGARGLVLQDKERRALEALLDAPLSDGGDLIRAVSKISAVGVGGFNVEFTQAERDEIAKRAAFNNRSPEQELAASFEFVKPLLFNAMVALAGVRDQASGKQRA